MVHLLVHLCVAKCATEFRPTKPCQVLGFPHIARPSHCVAGRFWAELENPIWQGGVGEAPWTSTEWAQSGCSRSSEKSLCWERHWRSEKCLGKVPDVPVIALGERGCIATAPEVRATSIGGTLLFERRVATDSRRWGQSYGDASPRAAVRRLARAAHRAGQDGGRVGSPGAEEEACQTISSDGPLSATGWNPSLR